jgi:hypothetical protein
MLKISIHTNHLLICMCINKKLLLESEIHTHLYVHLQKKMVIHTYYSFEDSTLQSYQATTVALPTRSKATSWIVVEVGCR